MNYPDGTCATCKHLSTRRDKMTGNCICTKGGIVVVIPHLDHGCMWYKYFLATKTAEHRKEQDND